jgi:hypothetical protein
VVAPTLGQPLDPPGLPVGDRRARPASLYWHGGLSSFGRQPGKGDAG